jgi:hypothetical protein
MKTLFEKTTFSFSSTNNLTCIAYVHLIFRAINVFFVFRRRRSRVSNKRCLICRQKFTINTSCLCFFMRCLKNICKRVICNWISCICVFISRICIDIVLKLSLIKFKFIVAIWLISSSRRQRYSNAHATRVKWRNRKWWSIKWLSSKLIWFLKSKFFTWTRLIVKKLKFVWTFFLYISKIRISF